METRKFEYLESIRDTIEHGEYEDLDDYLDCIVEEVRNDPDFAELLQEVRSKHYHDVVDLIDEIMFKDMQSEFQDLFENIDTSDLTAGENYELDMDIEDILPEGSQPEDVTFEPFNEEEFDSEIDSDY